MKAIILYFITLLQAVVLYGAGGPALPPLFAPPDRDGTLVLNFCIETLIPDEDGNTVLTVAALDEGQRVSFQLVLGKNWRLMPGEFKPGTGNRPAIGVVVLKSVGVPTEAFARAFAKACKVKVKKYTFTQAEFQAVSLGSSPSQMASEQIGLKIYQGARGRPGGGDYLGLFCQIDVRAATLIISEEKKEYRKSIVKLLTNNEPSEKATKK